MPPGADRGFAQSAGPGSHGARAHHRQPAGGSPGERGGDLANAPAFLETTDHRSAAAGRSYCRLVERPPALRGEWHLLSS